MLKQFITIIIFLVLFAGALIIKKDAPAWGQSSVNAWGAFSSTQILNANSGNPCGEKSKAGKYYFRRLLYIPSSPGFILVFGGIFADKKALKFGVWGLAVFPFALWTYVNYFVDFQHTQKISFAYDTVAENTLANIAEAQDRY